MARYYSERLISGRLGNQVFCIRNGKTYVRAYARSIKADSPKQLWQQARFYTTTKFLSQFKNILRIGYQNPYKKGLSEYTRAMQYHINNTLVESAISTADHPAFEVDLNKVILAIGNIQKPRIDCCERIGNEIELTWDSSLGNSNNRYYDQMVLVAYTPGKKVLSNFNIGSRISGKGSYILPDDYSDKVHVWVFYFSGQRKSTPSQDHISNSVYLGEV